ncbi:palmitoyl-(protein) hydrolase [Aureococcus anophagefferens]|nr:palmitoyl-(protein) hydrolase [Aureococcus anophagefferens]
MRVFALAAAASAAILEPIGYDREGSALAYLTNAGVEATAADVADLNKDAPSLVAMLAMATDAPEQLADLIKASPMSVIADEVSITEAAGKKLNAYATCVPTAEGWLFDTIDGFLKNMDKSVDFFAAKIRADPKLAGGFNAFGFSQGNNVIRGYITKYNDPPVKNFMSICGINAGVGAFPQCSPEIPVVGPTVCKGLAEVLGDLAYNKLVQDILFQANYYRDPAKTSDASYLKNSRLAHWNGEGEVNATYVANWAKTDNFIWVEGTLDTVVWPRQGEQWGAMDPKDPWKTVLPMNETDWYTKDSFGLKTADEAGKNHFESFVGEHIRMTDAQLMGWLEKYLA